MPPPLPPRSSGRRALKRGLAAKLVGRDCRCADCDCELAWGASPAPFPEKRAPGSEYTPVEPGDPFLVVKFGVVVCGACAAAHRDRDLAGIHGGEGHQESPLAVRRRRKQEQQSEDSPDVFPLAVVSLRREFPLLTLRQITFAQETGNQRQNDILECAVDASWAMKIPESLSPVSFRVPWIAAKYAGQFCDDASIEVLEDDDAEVAECARLIDDSSLSGDEGEEDGEAAAASETNPAPAAASGDAAEGSQVPEELEIADDDIENLENALAEISSDEEEIVHRRTSEPTWDDIDDSDDLVLSMIGNYNPAQAGSVHSPRNRLSFTMGHQRSPHASFIAPETEAPAPPVAELVAPDTMAPAPPGAAPEPPTEAESPDSGEAPSHPAPEEPPTDQAPASPGSRSQQKSKSKKKRRGTVREAFSDEGRRLRSFSTSRRKDGQLFVWPHLQPTPETLAGAGFFFAPTEEKPDRVSCFDCGAGLTCWEPGDDPLREHRRVVAVREAKSPRRACSFLRAKGLSEMRAVLESLLVIPANLKCAECRDENLELASDDHGIFLCRPCGEAHVSFGISANMLELPPWTNELRGRGRDAGDDAPSPTPWPREALRRFVFLGNTTHREVWEYKLTAAAQAKVVELSDPTVMEEMQRLADLRPDASKATPEQRREWLAVKYEDRSFALPHSDKTQSVFFTNVLQDHGSDVLEYLVGCFSEQPDFEGTHADGQDISSPSARGRERRPTARRALRKEGWLTKHGHGARSWRKNRHQWWVLRDNFLFAYASEGSTHVLKAVSLLHAKVEVVEEQPVGAQSIGGSDDITRHNFRLVTPQKTIVLHAEGPREQEDWISVLGQNIRWLEANDFSATSPAGQNELLAVTIDDEPIRQGFIWVGSAGAGKRKRRWCVLQDDSLFCFSNAKEAKPILAISIRSAVVELEDAGKEHKRPFTLHSHDGSFDMACDTRGKSREWVDDIRRRSEALAAKGVPAASSSDMAGTPDAVGKERGASHSQPTLKRAAERQGVVKSDFMHKKGDKSKGGVRWKKRWFVLKDGQLAYFKKSTDTVPAGTIELAAAKARNPVFSDDKKAKGKIPFEVVTPTRTYSVGASSDAQRDEWIQAINDHMEEVIRAKT
jgi:PH domain/Inhibitor of Apoptosis domain/Putative GTPase activating protein for Arf